MVPHIVNDNPNIETVPFTVDLRVRLPLLLVSLQHGVPASRRKVMLHPPTYAIEV